MGYYLFDNPKMAIILACVLEFLACVCWIFARDRFNKLLFLIGPAVIGIFILLDQLVRTNREKLQDATRIIVKAAEDEDPDSILQLISDNFLYKNYLNKLGAAQYIKSYLRKPVIVSNSIREITVKNLTERQGQVEFRVLTHFEPKGPYGFVPLLMTRWRFDYLKDSDGQYRVHNIEMLNMGDQKGIDIFRKSIIY